MKSSHLVLLALFLSPALAHGWESECRPESAAVSMFGGHAGSVDDSICAGAEPVCEYGLEWTRAALLGEHTWITRRALVQAGLSAYADRPVLSYYTNGTNVMDAEGNSVATLVPAREGRANAFVERKTTLAEFAQAADGSHSLSDFLLGNESCPVEHLPGATAADRKACHSFNPHMGAINSTHFLPQARVVYKRYHDHALEVAARCLRMKEGLAMAADHPLADAANEAIEECELEALMFESVASHFLADAWSSGHMWQRWGVPLASSAPWKRLAQSAVAVISGMIHGWRSVVRDLADIDLQHDQMCMPGPFDPDGTPDEADVVQFRMPPDGQVVDGGGDLYLLPCLAFEEDRNWSVAEGPTLAAQKKRMLTCIARGFEEVYQAGPRTMGELQPVTGERDSAMDGKTSLDPACWDGRVTNRSFLLGMHLSDTASLADLKLVSRLILKLVLGNQAAGLEDVGVSEEELDRVGRHARKELVELAAIARYEAKADPEGTSLADAEGKPTFLGNPRNSAFVRGDTFSQFVGYYERDRLWWNPSGGSACTKDADCNVAAGEYCDQTISEKPVCMPIGASILRTFRDGELEYWCKELDPWEVTPAIEHCRTTGTATACEACKQIVLPHLRNTCDQEGLDSDPPGGRDPRSLCDILVGEDSAPFYRVYGDGGRAGAEAAALEICNSDPSVVPPPNGYWMPDVQPAAIELDPATAMMAVDVSTAAMGPELDWQTFSTHPSLAVMPISWSIAAGTAQSVTVQATDFSTPFLSEVEFSNECNPELKAAVAVRVGGGFTHISFDNDPMGAVTGNEWQAQGVTFSGGGTLNVGGDDVIGTYGLCSVSGNGCNSSITMSFTTPVTAVSFYVGDRDRDRKGTFTIQVTDSNGGVLESIATNYDRRFYTFAYPDIQQITFTPSDEWELLDELYFTL